MVKANNKQNLIQKLKPSNKRTQLLAIVLIFAVIGGGIMIYRSFANTIARTWTVANGTLGAVQSSSVVCKATPATDGSKNGLAVISLICSGGGEPSIGKSVSASAIKNQDPTALGGHNYRLCASMKGSGTVSINWNPFNATSPPSTADGNYLVAVNSPTSYKSYCSTKQVFVNNPYGRIDVKVLAWQDKTNVNVSDLSLELVTPPPAVNPTECGKSCPQ